MLGPDYFPKKSIVCHVCRLNLLHRLRNRILHGSSFFKTLSYISAPVMKWTYKSKRQQELKRDESMHLDNCCSNRLLQVNIPTGYYLGHSIQIHGFPSSQDFLAARIFNSPLRNELSSHVGARICFTLSASKVLTNSPLECDPLSSYKARGHPNLSAMSASKNMTVFAEIARDSNKSGRSTSNCWTAALQRAFWLRLYPAEEIHTYERPIALLLPIILMGVAISIVIHT